MANRLWSLTLSLPDAAASASNRCLYSCVDGGLCAAAAPISSRPKAHTNTAPAANCELNLIVPPVKSACYGASRTSLQSRRSCTLASRTLLLQSGLAPFEDPPLYSLAPTELIGRPLPLPSNPTQEDQCVRVPPTSLLPSHFSLSRHGPLEHKPTRRSSSVPLIPPRLRNSAPVWPTMETFPSSPLLRTSSRPAGRMPISVSHGFFTPAPAASSRPRSRKQSSLEASRTRLAAPATSSSSPSRIAKRHSATLTQRMHFIGRQHS